MDSPFATESGPPFSAAPEPEDVTPVRPPRFMLHVAGLMVVLGGSLWLFDRLAAHFAGYVMSSFIAMGLVVWFHREDARRRQDRRYSPERQLRTIATVIILVGVVVAGTHVWVLATHLAT